VEASVETTVETDGMSPLTVRMLGPLAVKRDGAPVVMPRSRKVRALLAYLVLAPSPVSRSRLCDLLWDGPNDPRGELRWCLTKLRGIFDGPAAQRIETTADMVRIRLDGCFVDAAELSSVVAGGLAEIETDRLRNVAALFTGEFLEGLDVDRSPHFDNWVLAQRRRCQALQIVVLEQLVSRFPVGDENATPWLEIWLALSPFDLRAHRALLAALLATGRIEAGESHLDAAVRLLQSEDIDPAPLRDFWKERRRATVGAQPVIVEPIDSTMIPTPVDPLNASRRASLAVMPFAEHRSNGAWRGGLADGLTHDIITRLAKLKDFFVIARGSVYALSERGVGPEEAGRRLNVDFVASGTVRQHGNRVSVDVELVSVPTARIIWSETFETKPDDLFPVMDEIGNSIVASIATEIETAERNRAILKAPNSLNAWEAYHRGLWHMYRFTREDNERARGFFGMATGLDPTFARAHAGLSFTHWQSAFQRWGDRDREAALAYQTAGESVLVDDHNPAAHWAMGRALWLRGSNDESLSELQRAVELSPNFALGHYALSFVHSQSGDPLAAIGSADLSRHLSPFDPLLFGMLGTRAMAHVRLGQFEEAAEWALKAAARPNSHAIILAIAAYCLGLAGRIEEGRAFAGRIRQSLPHYNADEFLASFHMAPEAALLFRKGAKRIGLE
jgi:DNA-binding SARP family transcriptional activator/TolB-like protein